MCRWYSFNFNISWDAQERPKTWVDIFIIDTIVREVILQKKSEILLWRIHRRWARDVHGHELTFDCFTNEEAASEVEKTIRDSHAFEVLHERGGLVNGLKVIPGETDTRGLTYKENWPESLKKAWPYYINGCCEMFLHLIDALRGGNNVPADISEAEQYYTRVNNELVQIWQHYGSDSFFHHVSGIFGYEPLYAQPRTLLVF